MGDVGKAGQRVAAVALCLFVSADGGGCLYRV